MGKSTISMAIFNSYVKLPEGIHFNRPFVFFTVRQPVAKKAEEMAVQVLKKVSDLVGDAQSPVELRYKAWQKMCGGPNVSSKWFVAF